MNREPLTEKQQQLYDFLLEYIPKNGRSPTIREMMERFNYSSPAPVQGLLWHLRYKKYITPKNGKARSIEIVGKSLQWVDQEVA